VSVIGISAQDVRFFATHVDLTFPQHTTASNFIDANRIAFRIFGNKSTAYYKWNSYDTAKKAGSYKR